MRSAVVVALLLSACTADVDIIQTDESAGGPSIEDHALPNNARIAYQYFVNKGLTRVAGRRDGRQSRCRSRG